MVTLNPCDSGRYYTCEEGSCILNTGRYDGRKDCRTYNDERNCNTLCETQDNKGIKSKILNATLRIHVELGKAFLVGIGVMVLSSAQIPQMKFTAHLLFYKRNDVDVHLREHLQRKSNGNCRRNMLMCDLDDVGFCYHQYGWCVYEVLQG